MGLKKRYHLFPNKNNQESKQSKQSKQSKESKNSLPSNLYDKKIIEELISSLQNKLKDPKLTKKAAHILSNWKDFS